MSEAELGRAIGVGQAAVNRYIRGERIPRPDVMRRIVETTNGAVGPADFYDLTPAATGSESSRFEAA